MWHCLMLFLGVLKPFLQKDIRQLDFPELRRAGYRGAVFDKDNCLVSALPPCKRPPS